MDWNTAAGHTGHGGFSPRSSTLVGIERRLSNAFVTTATYTTTKKNYIEDRNGENSGHIVLNALSVHFLVQSVFVFFLVPVLFNFFFFLLFVKSVS